MLASWADVDIQLGIVVEGAAGQAALGVGRALFLGQRDINGDAARLAGRDLSLGEIAAVGEDLRRRDLRPLGGVVREDLAGLLGHHRELAVVVVGVGDLVGRNQAVPIVDNDLHVVAGDLLAVFGEPPGVRIGARELRLAGLGEDLQLITPAPSTLLQRGELLGSERGLRRAGRLAGIGGVDLLVVALDVALQCRQLPLELLFGFDAARTGIAVEEAAVQTDPGAAVQPRLTAQQHELAIDRLERLGVVFAEIRNRRDRA